MVMGVFWVAKGRVEWWVVGEGFAGEEGGIREEKVRLALGLVPASRCLESWSENISEACNL